MATLAKLLKLSSELGATIYKFLSMEVEFTWTLYPRVRFWTRGINKKDIRVRAVSGPYIIHANIQ
jgi:hypothetical protein